MLGLHARAVMGMDAEGLTLSGPDLSRAFLSSFCCACVQEAIRAMLQGHHVYALGSQVGTRMRLQLWQMHGCMGGPYSVKEICMSPNSQDNETRADPAHDSGCESASHVFSPIPQPLDRLLGQACEGQGPSRACTVRQLTAYACQPDGTHPKRPAGSEAWP